MKKKFILMLLFLVFVVNQNIYIYASENTINTLNYNNTKIIFNGKELNLLKPFIDVTVAEENELIYMPLREVLEALGHKLDSKNNCININSFAENNPIRKVTKTYSNIKTGFYNDEKISIDGKELELDEKLITIIDGKFPDYLVNYIPVDKILESLNYVVDWDLNSNIIFITQSTNEIYITAQDSPIEYKRGKPYKEGAFTYLPLNETIEALGHSVYYEHKNNKISEARLTVRSNSIILPIDSNEIIIIPPKVGSNYVIKGNDETYTVPVKSNQIVDLMGEKEKKTEPYIFNSYGNTIVDENGIVYVELSLINEIFEIKPGKNNFEINIIDEMVQNFELNGMDYQPWQHYEFNSPIGYGNYLEKKYKRTGEAYIDILITDDKNEEYHGHNVYLDEITGEIISVRNNNVLDYLKERDFRDKIPLTSYPTQFYTPLPIIELSRFYVENAAIDGYTKNGYQICYYERPDFYWILFENNKTETACYVYHNTFYRNYTYPG